MSPIVTLIEKHHKFASLIYLLVVPLTVVVVAVYGYVRFDQFSERLAMQAELGQEAHDAVCTFREDLRRRVNSSKDFLEKNPNGIPGLDGATIRNSIVNQQKTVDALAILNCKEKVF